MKKLLALVLALVMSMSLVTISNAAFSDADKIDHKEAVEVMNALGVINGMPDGSFAPAGNVTRAEMAKMISIISLGNIDPDAFKGTATDLTDINGHWAEGFIKYCYSQGVIAGRGDGTFAPNANVTAVEAAKMLLVAIGYNASVQGYVGADWTINVIRDAQLSKFFDDLSVTSTKVLTRDETAQMIWNAVQAKMIEKKPSISITNGNITYTYEQHPTNTLLNTTFKAEKKYAYLTGASYSSDDYTYSFTTAAAFGGGQITTDALVNNTTTSLDGKTDYSALYGQKVAVVYNTTSGAKNPVYGIYSEAKVVAEGIVNDLAAATDANKVKVAGTTYTLTAANRSSVPVYQFNAGTTTYTRADLDAVISGNAASTWYDASAKVVLLDNTGDNKADVVIIYPVTIGKVTYASKTSVVVDGGVGTFAYNKDKANWSNTNSYTLPELVKDDYVAVAGTTVTNVDYAVTKLDTVSGKVTALDAGNRKVQLDSTWYNYAGTVSFTLSDTVKVQLNNGLIVASKVVDTASKDLLVLEAAENGNSLRKIQAKVMFADGTEETISVKKVNGTATTTAPTPLKTLYTYTKNSDGTYNISAVNAGNKAGYTTYAESTTGTGLFTEKSSSSAAKFSGQMIADDAVFFVYDSTNDKWNIVSGAAMKTYATKNGGVLYSVSSTDYYSQMLLGTSNGVYGVKAATMQVTAAFGTSNTYGYVLSAPYTSKDANDVTVYNYKLWTADGEKTVVDTNNPGAKGTLVKYTVNTDNTITSAAHGLTAVAITAYNDETITLNKADGTVLGKVNTTISTKADKLFINTADVAGSEGGALAVAQRLADGSYVMNAYAAVDGNGVVTAIVFDINNDLDDTNAHKDDADGTKTGTAGMTATGLSATTSASYVKEYTYVVEGEYVKITATLTAAADGKTLTATAGGTNVQATSGSITLPASGTAIGDTFVMYVLVANDGNGAISGLTFTVTEA